LQYFCNAFLKLYSNEFTPCDINVGNVITIYRNFTIMRLHNSVSQQYYVIIYNIAALLEDSVL